MADVRAGTEFVPMHWSNQFASAARIGTLIAAVADPVSGQPELKHTPVRVIPELKALLAEAVTATM
jgi:assimilatory nitrate reductase catalytic subunit